MPCYHGQQQQQCIGSRLSGPMVNSISTQLWLSTSNHNFFLSSRRELSHAQVLSDGTLQCLVTCMPQDASIISSSSSSSSMSLSTSQSLTIQVAVDNMGRQYLTAGTVTCVDAPTIVSHSPSMLLEGALVGNFSITVVLADPVVANDPTCVFGAGGEGMESLGLAKTVFYVGPSRYMRVVCVPPIRQLGQDLYVSYANFTLGLQTLSIRSGSIVTLPVTFQILPMVAISPTVTQPPGAMVMVSSSDSLVTIPLTGQAPVELTTSTYVLVPASVCLVTRVSDKGVVTSMGKTTATLLAQGSYDTTNDGNNGSLGGGDVVGCDISILSLPTDIYTLEVILGGVSIGTLPMRMFSVPDVIALQPNVCKSLNDYQQSFHSFLLCLLCHILIDHY